MKVARKSCCKWVIEICRLPSFSVLAQKVVFKQRKSNQGAVKKMCSARSRVVFDDDGSFIENKDSGIRTEIREEKGRYILDLYVDGPEEPRDKPIRKALDFVGLEDENI